MIANSKINSKIILKIELSKILIFNVTYNLIPTSLYLHVDILTKTFALSSGPNDPN